ncbi:hypothetical protein L249_7601, partial [Ophiocordyceps polyrhachis-furcata BCC 54312]
TRPEGLGGSRDAGPAVAGPRPPYVTEAERHNNVGGGYGTATPYSGYGRTGRTGQCRFPSAKTGDRDRGAFRGPFSRCFVTALLFRQQRQQTQKDYLITGCQEGGRTRGPRQQTSRPSSSFLRQGSQRLIPRSFFSTFAADTATATATANALVATIPLLLLLSLSNAFFHPIFSAAFFVLWSSVLFFPPSSSYGRPYGLQRRQDQGRGIQQFLDQFEERVLTEDLPWPAAKTALLRYYGAFNQIRTVGFYDKLRRHEARRPKTKDTIDWLEKHAFLCRKVGPSPGPDESTEHSYGLFQALPKEIQGLGGSRDAGPAVAGPRPPYVTEAVRHSGCGYGTATPYSGYGRTGRTGRTREGT